MAGYQELIKNFAKLRDCMRDFFVYGFKTRDDFKFMSGRTYDNERRHIENFLGKYVRWEYSKTGKRVFLSFNTLRFTQNPFYQAYLAKSFTGNDIVLHFYLLDMFSTGFCGGADAITDEIANRYDQCFDAQTVRAKLLEYARLGILLRIRVGRSYQYRLQDTTLKTLFADIKNRDDALSFFTEVAPLGIIGHYLQQGNNLVNKSFMFKHHFIAATLDDEIVLTILQAMHEHRYLQFVNFSERVGTEKTFVGMPVKILVSLQNGRRYVAVKHGNKLACFRLDYIKKAKVGEKVSGWEHGKAWTDHVLKQAWGIAHAWRSKKEKISFVLHIDEQQELYVLERLQRERRTGEISKLADNIFCYSATVSDVGELLPWIRTFIGHIKAFNCSNLEVQKRWEQDLQNMFALYGGEC